MSRLVFKNQLGNHLGDMFILVSAALRLSEQTGQPTYLQAKGPAGVMLTNTMIQDIAALCDSHGTVVPTNEPATESFGQLWKKLWLMPTKKRWTPGPHGRCAYQFDGRSMPEKNPPDEDVPKLLAAMARKAEPVKVGLPLSIAESVEVLATSDFFVGSASGLAIVAWAVGVPVYYLEYKMPVDPFITGGQPYVKCIGTQGLRVAIRQWPQFPTEDLPGRYALRGRWPIPAAESELLRVNDA